MHFIDVNDVRAWFSQAADLSEYMHGIGGEIDDDQFIDLPRHLQFAVERKATEVKGPVPREAFDSIPFYSLCRGLFLPLSGLAPERIEKLFGLKVAPFTESREVLVGKFLDKEIGLSLLQKMACLLGDPFLGRRGTFRRDSLIRLLRSIRLVSREALLDRLTVVGEVAAIFAESFSQVKGDPPLTALEVLESLRFLPEARTTRKFEVLRSLIARCGKMEVYFVVKLLLRNAGFGFDYQGPLLTKVLSERFGAPPQQIEHAMALTDPLRVAKVLAEEGAEGLRKIQLKPLSPVRPALASGSVEDIKKYPVWVERKYDGVRLLLHKSTDARGSILCGAYTRNRGDWLELIPGMGRTIPLLPAQSCIVDGELFGSVVGLEGARPASVYEVYTMIQGEPIRPVQLKYAAFDILYLNGQDLTRHSLAQRRQALSALMMPITGMPLPVPITVSEGQLVDNREGLNRLFQHFRSQGYEGIIAKNLAGPYHLATRDPDWVKKKPEITLDLVLLGGVLAVTSKENVGLFGSYVVGARNDQGGFEIVGDVAGLDKMRDTQIQAEVMRLGLLTGRRIERQSASGVRPGLEFRPAIVVTIKFEGIIHDQKTGLLHLRDPKIALVRSDKSAFEADEVATIKQLYIDQNIG